MLYILLSFLVLQNPKKGNLIGKNLPRMEDRHQLAKIILEPFPLRNVSKCSHFFKLNKLMDMYIPFQPVPQAFRSAKGCAKRKNHQCLGCKGLFTDLMRHNCKGLARDGGIVAQRTLKFCPLCLDLRSSFQYLPRHIRTVTQK